MRGSKKAALFLEILAFIAIIAFFTLLAIAGGPAPNDYQSEALTFAQSSPELYSTVKGPVTETRRYNPGCYVSVLVREVDLKADGFYDSDWIDSQKIFFVPESCPELGTEITVVCVDTVVNHTRQDMWVGLNECGLVH